MALVEVSKLAAEQPGVARFASACACGFTTILHVPVAYVAGGEGSMTGGYQCDGCGLEHRFAVTITGGPN